MTKQKKLVLGLSATTAIAFAFSVATPFIVKKQNNHQKIVAQFTEKIEKETEIKKDFNLFVNSQPIKKTLEILFRHEKDSKKAMTEYIENQYKLIFSNKHNLIRNKLFFINGITNSLSQQDNLLWLTKEKKPYFKRNDSKYFETEFGKMLTEDWLWFLYNITYFRFAFTPNKADLSDQNLENIVKISKDIGAFYNPKSNILIDYSHQTIIDDKNDNTITYTFDYLTAEGFILHFEIKKEMLEINGKRVEGKILHKDILPIMYTFTKIRKSKNILRDFDIRRYSSVFSDFQDLENTSIKRNVFEERHGGKRLSFSLYCMQNQ